MIKPHPTTGNDKKPRPCPDYDISVPATDYDKTVPDRDRLSPNPPDTRRNDGQIPGI